MDQILIISSVLLWIGLLFNFLLILGLTRRLSKINLIEEETLKEGTVAPPFQAKSLDGISINQDFYEGKAVAFMFVGPGCQACIDFMPHLIEVIPYVKKSGVELVLVSEGSPEGMENYLAEYKLNLPALITQKEKDKNFMDNYKVNGTPSYCLVDAKGIVQGSGYPGLKAEIFQKKISLFGQEGG